MATFVLVPGAGGNASYWSWLVPELESRGHRAVAIELEQDDPSLTLADFARTVDDAITDRADTVLVAQSLGGFVAPLVRGPLRMVVLLNAMIPQPGETPGAWWGNVGSEPARRAAAEADGRDPEFDEERDFFHDIPDEIKVHMLAGPQPRRPADTIFGLACDFERWPANAVRVLTGRDDRFFPAGFQRRVAKERLGLDVDEVPGGHLAAISNAAGVADKLVAYLAELPAAQGG